MIKLLAYISVTQRQGVLQYFTFITNYTVN